MPRFQKRFRDLRNNKISIKKVAQIKARCNENGISIGKSKKNNVEFFYFDTRGGRKRKRKQYKQHIWDMV